MDHDTYVKPVVDGIVLEFEDYFGNAVQHVISRDGAENLFAQLGHALRQIEEKKDDG
jgi:hypothetical protein